MNARFNQDETLAIFRRINRIPQRHRLVLVLDKPDSRGRIGFEDMVSFSELQIRSELWGGQRTRLYSNEMNLTVLLDNWFRPRPPL